VFDAVCPIHGAAISRRRAASLAVQSDNETCYMFHDQPYATDYGADSISLYRHYLGQKHISIENLNAAYCTEYDSFDQVDPPRACEIHSDRTCRATSIDRIQGIPDSLCRGAFPRGMLKERGLTGIRSFTM